MQITFIDAKDGIICIKLYITTQVRTDSSVADNA